jgi:hypothetical protein
MIHVILALSLALGPSEPLLRDLDAQHAFEAAQKAFAEKDYATASAQLEKAYMLEPEPELLYPWAQAERNLGRCESAIDLYEKFIDTGPSQKMVEAAQQNIERCKETMAGDPPPVPEVEPEVEPEPETDPEPPPPRVDPSNDTAPKDDKPVGKDVAGAVLVGLGGAAIVTGAVLLGIASKQAKFTKNADDNETYLVMRDKATKFNGAGIGVLVAGGVLVVAGVVRYGVLAKRKKSKDTALFFDGRTVGIAGRF